MDVLVFLKRIRNERLELKRMEDQHETLRESLLPAAIRYDRDKVQSSPSDHMLEVAANMSVIEERMQRHAAKLTKDIDIALQIIEEMPTPECRELLQLRYLDSDPERPRVPMTWIDIGYAMGYTPEHVRGKLHGKAIREAREAWNARDYT